MSAKRHRHKFTGLYAHFGPYRKKGAVHYHVCFDTDCDRVLVGEGRDCSGRMDDHWRETLGRDCGEDSA